MSLWNGIRDIFRPAPPPPPPPKLRNKPGGLAWIRIVDRGDGAFALNRRVVQTVRADPVSPGFWVIDPPQKFQAQVFMLSMSGGLIPPGAVVDVMGMHDDLLEPIRDVGDEERDESAAWLPPVPAAPKVPEKA